jgi:hypothetical protein
MTNQPDRNESQQPDAGSYDAPTLTTVGAASEVVLGVSGGGFDGDFGMTDPEFEFEADGGDD